MMKSGFQMVELINDEIVYEILSCLRNSRDHAAFFCTCKKASLQLDAFKRMQNSLFKEQYLFGDYYNNYHLSKYQQELLLYLWNNYNSDRPYSYCKMPMCNGRLASVLIYSHVFIEKNDCSVLIAAPLANVLSLVQESKRIGISDKVHFYKKECNVFPRRSIVLIDRARRSRNLDLAVNNVGCLFVDEAHSGDTSLKNICKEVWLAEEESKSLQFILLTSANKIRQEECVGKLELYFLPTPTQFISMTFDIYRPDLQELQCYMPTIHHYPCLLKQGSYYSVKASEESLRLVESVLAKPYNNSSLEEFRFFSESRELELVESCNDNTSVEILSLALLCDIIKLYNEKYLIVCSCKKETTTVENICQTALERVSVTALTKQVDQTDARNIVFFNYKGAEERGRYYIEQLQARANCKFFRIWTIGTIASLVFSIVPSQALVNNYLASFNDRKSQLDENGEVKGIGPNLSLSSVSAKYFKKDLSLGEIVVFARKTVSKKTTAFWLSKQNNNYYTTEQAMAIVKQKNPLTETEEGCFVIDLEPIIIQKGSEEEVFMQEPPSLEMLREIVTHPRKKKMYNIDQLRFFCKNQKLSTIGKKGELAQRLLASLEK